MPVVAVKTKIFIFLIGLSAVAQVVPAFSAGIQGLRYWSDPGRTRLIFDFSAPLKYRIFQLNHPDRLVIDFLGAELTTRIKAPASADPFLKRVRSSRRHDHDLRVVLDLKSLPQIKETRLKPNQQYGHRLVIDLLRKKAAMTVKTATQHVLRDVVVAIDAGHGGVDPGAKGYRGSYEKDVVLGIARRLARLVAKEPGMRAVLIRDGDYFISLRERTIKARRAKADLFISLHADSFHNRRAKGISIYVLSQHGASDEAGRWLAQRENEADLVGGVRLDDKDDLLASVLLDLSQNATNDASYAAANDVLRIVRGLGYMHKKRVQQAGFVVLKSPDIPSMLIETAFITNPEDERRLNNSTYQKKLAVAILSGLRHYFTRHPLDGTAYASRRHIISDGDTLSTLAQQYHVSIGKLRIANGLKGDNIHIGRILKIPRMNSDS